MTTSIPPIEKPVLVFAGNYNQYRDFLREHDLNPREWRYVSRPDQIMGMRSANYIKVGQWYLNPIMDKQPELTQVYDMKEIKI